MATTWTDGRIVGFDLETTSPIPEEARIVTAAVVSCGGGTATETQTWIADPGVDIPDEAAQIHGVTTERARAEGRPVDEVVREVIASITQATQQNEPLVIFNARFDLTVLDRSARRIGVQPLTPRIGRDIFVVDPFVIDRWLDTYRRGSRRLDAQAQHYGVTLDEAHEAAADAIAACRIAWMMGKHGAVVRKAWNPQMESERAMLEAEWAELRGSLPLLHAAQARWAAAERTRFANYKREQGEHDQAKRIAAEVGWPVLDDMEHEHS